MSRLAPPAAATARGRRCGDRTCVPECLPRGSQRFCRHISWGSAPRVCRLTQSLRPGSGLTALAWTPEKFGGAGLCCQLLLVVYPPQRNPEEGTKLLICTFVWCMVQTEQSVHPDVRVGSLHA